MTSAPAKLGDWNCYDNAENKLQAHNVSHKRPQRRMPTTLRSRIKRYFASLFRKSRPHMPSVDNQDDDWTCHGRTLMRYTIPPSDSPTIITSGDGIPGDSATASAWNSEQYYSMSPTLVAESPMYETFSHSAGVHDHAHPHEESSYVAPTPRIPNRSTLRMVTPTTPLDVHGTQDSMV